MMLYIVRHGIAVDIGTNGVTSDATRMLSEEGRRKTNEIGASLAVLGVTADIILTSPLVRAYETAEILNRHLARSGSCCRAAHPKCE